MSIIGTVKLIYKSSCSHQSKVASSVSLQQTQEFEYTSLNHTFIIQYSQSKFQLLKHFCKDLLHSHSLRNPHLMSLCKRPGRPKTSLVFFLQVLQAGRVQPLFMIAVFCELLQHIHDLSLVDIRGGLSLCKYKKTRMHYFQLSTYSV